jgi:hypothetical protein
VVIKFGFIGVKEKSKRHLNGDRGSSEEVVSFFFVETEEVVSYYNS